MIHRTTWALGALMLAAVASAQDGRPTEALTRWRRVSAVPLPGGSQPWVDLLVTADVFDAAREDLGDLRLYDAAGAEVPYALRVRRSQQRLEQRATAPFDRGQAADGASELSLDLESDALEHNQVEVRTAGTDVRRKVELDGSDDRRTWKRLAAGLLLDFEAGGQRLVRRTLDYGATRYRYLRVRVHPDPLADRGPVEIVGVDVRHAVDIAGEPVVTPAALGQIEYLRRAGQPATAWRVDLGANRPVEALEVEVEDAEFAREVQVERLDGSDTTWLAETGWRRRPADARRPLIVELPADTRARWLRLIVLDRRNQPLIIRAVRARAAARQLIFARPGPDAGPLRLYAGNPTAQAPGYDLANTLPRVLDPPAVRATPAAAIDNPDYRPEPPTLSERAPWLIHLVLGAVSIALGLLVVSVARAAIRAHDQAVAEGGAR